MTFLVAAPTLTVAARLVLDTPPAGAAPKSGGPKPDPATEPTTESDLGTTYVLRVRSDNRVIFESPKADVGQGISTAIAVLLAEDLDARPADIDVTLSDAEGLPGQSVGGSASIRGMWQPARDLAAQARARLITAAAERWSVPANTLWTQDSTVFAPDGRSATYGSLAADAARVSSPAVSTQPKPATQHAVIGTPTAQLEGRDIITGKTIYAMDIGLPGALPTVVARPPTIKGTVASFDDTTARAMSGVVAVTPIPTGVAVSAGTFWEAMRTAEALHVSWGAGPVDAVSDAKVNERLDQAIPPFADPPVLSNYVDGKFEFAFVNHAPMETVCTAADVRAGTAEIWCSSKVPNGARTAVAEVTGLAEAAVTVHVTRGGGSFGRRLYPEAEVEAAQVSQAIGKPVKLMWTRADEMRHGRMRPASHHRMRIVYLANELVSFENLSSAVQLDLGLSPVKDMIDPGYGGYPTIGAAFFALTQVTPYNLGVETKLLNEVPLDFPTATWRSVYSGHNRAAEEIMVDALAKKLGRDPLGLRMELAKTAAAKAVLQKLATAAGWGRTMPAGWAQGIAYHEEYNSKAGCLVEINATNPQAPRVTKAVVVADVGTPVNPSGLKAQFMGSVMDGISTILSAGNHISGGAVVEKSFADFRWARQTDAPLQFDVHLMPPDGGIGGAGELVVPAAAGAVANAYASATGKQAWRFPINS
ncbi:MAG: molybdopterin-dependent oxidoreductase [Actinophytocola sp.]|nr:molybdopterin-dependent oxidoreductase [Actinophytocola sp.]